MSIVYTTIIRIGAMEVYRRSDMPHVYFWCLNSSYNGRGPFSSIYAATADYKAYLQAKKEAQTAASNIYFINNIIKSIFNTTPSNIIKVDFINKKRIK